MKEHYALLFATSTMGLARLEVYENEKASLSGPYTFIIVANDVIKVQRLHGNSQTMLDSNSFVVSYVVTKNICDKSMEKERCGVNESQSVTLPSPHSTSRTAHETQNVRLKRFSRFRVTDCPFSSWKQCGICCQD